MERRHVEASKGRRIPRPLQPLSMRNELINGAENSSSITSGTSKKVAKNDHMSPRVMVEEEAEKLGWLFFESTGESIAPENCPSDRSVPITYILKQGLVDGTLPHIFV